MYKKQKEGHCQLAGSDQDSYSGLNSRVFKGPRTISGGAKWKEMLENQL